jgi:hypothetical protein
VELRFAGFLGRKQGTTYSGGSQEDSRECLPFLGECSVDEVAVLSRFAGIEIGWCGCAIGWCSACGTEEGAKLTVGGAEVVTEAETRAKGSSDGAFDVGGGRSVFDDDVIWECTETRGVAAAES